MITGSTSALDDRVWAVNMKHIMPSVAQQSNAADSWEALSAPKQLSNVSAEEQSSMSLPASRLSHLTHLVWPQIPAKASDLLARRFPKVVVNPKSSFCPAEADQQADLDDQFMHMVAPFWQQEEEQVCPVLCQPASFVVSQNVLERREWKSQSMLCHCLSASEWHTYPGRSE